MLQELDVYLAAALCQELQVLFFGMSCHHPSIVNGHFLAASSSTDLHERVVMCCFASSNLDSFDILLAVGLPRECAPNREQMVGHVILCFFYKLYHIYHIILYYFYSAV